MTRKQNLVFLWVGAAGFAALFVAAAVNAAIVYSGGDNSQFQKFINAALPFVGFPSFVCLFWFGIGPRFGTRMFLRGGFDPPNYQVMMSPMKWIVLIEDDPRVLRELRSGR